MEKPRRRLTRNDLFYRFMIALFVIVICYGAGVAVIIIAEGADHYLSARMINVFASMFAAFISFGAGYLYGAGANGNGDHRKDDDG